MAHSDDATKKLEKAVPTLNSDGKVIKWDIDYSYTKGDYSVTYSEEKHQTEESVEQFDLKAPSEFKKSDLVALCPTSNWDQVFNSQYESTHPETAPAVETRDDDFDVDTLAY